MAELDEVVSVDSEEAAAVDDISNEYDTDTSVGLIPLVIEERFRKAKQHRYNDEIRWMKAYRNYRGLYGPDVAFTETEKSKVFVKVTKTKVLAGVGQIMEVLLGGSGFPLTIDPTTLPEGISDAVHFSTQDTPETPKAPEEMLDELPPLQPGDTRSPYERLNAAMQERLAPVQDKLEEGPGTTPDTITIHPAMVSAKKMEKKIKDQLEEANGAKELRSFTFDCVLYGTGIMSGPFAIEKEYPSWTEDGDYEPTFKKVPSASHVDLWSFYPDPDASKMEDCEYVVVRHKMARSKLRELKNRPYFRHKAIDKAVKLGESYTEEWWEQALGDDGQEAVSDRFEVFEFWGTLDREDVEGYDVTIPSKLKDSEQIQVNAWMCNGEIIRLVMNPFKPAYIPFYACPYEFNPGSFFGIGISENMDDSQTLMNGFMRMAVDNAALSGNLIIEVDESALVPGQDMDVYPGKKFIRQGGAPGQAIFSHEFKNVSSQNMMMFDKARVLADESTGFPSFAHGQTGVQGVGRTAAGISMLMGAANGAVRTVIRNIDDYLITPMGKGFFRFNMQFDRDPEIKGDLEVRAQGTRNLMANEVRSQRLMQFLQLTQNPTLAPFAKMDYILSEIARSMDLDPDKVVNNMADAAIQAEVLKEFQAQMGAVPPEMAAGGPPGVGDTQGSGAGNIGVGSAPIPGEKGHSAAGGGDVPQAAG